MNDQVLILFRGLPGVGKTKIVKKLAPLINAKIVSRDIIRMQIFSPPDFSLEEKHFIDDVVLGCTRLYLLRGENVIVDGTAFSRAEAVQQYVDLASTFGIKLLIFHCICEDKVAKDRIEYDRKNNKHPARDRTINLYKKVRNDFETITYPYICLQTDKKPSCNVKIILDCLPENLRRNA
ncbi:MAG: ATP-binding protein [Candidatus Coatesbacteria bacterium]|nr:ATP-binding protein [Candidatus Coatesbacteria bacterium]